MTRYSRRISGLGLALHRQSRHTHVAKCYVQVTRWEVVRDWPQPKYAIEITYECNALRTAAGDLLQALSNAAITSPVIRQPTVAEKLFFVASLHGQLHLFNNLLHRIRRREMNF